MYKESQIVYEKDCYFVLVEKETLYKIYKIGSTHSTKVATISMRDGSGLQRAIVEIDRRIEKDKEKENCLCRV